MSTTVRHAFGDMSSAGTGKFAAALLTSTAGSENASSAASNIAAIESASRMSHAVASTGAPIASIAARPASRCSSLRLADHDGRAEPRELRRDGLSQARAGAGHDDAHPVVLAGLQRGGADGRRGREPDRFGHLVDQLPVYRGSRSSARAARISAMSSLRLMNVW